MRSHSVIAAAACLLVLVSAGTAQAQPPRPERPYRGLFGAGDDTDLRQAIRVFGSVGGGWDTDRAEGLRSDSSDPLSQGFRSLPPGTLGSGALGQFSGGLSYLFSSDIATLNAAASTSGRYYPDGSSDIIRRDNVGLNGFSRLGLGLSVTGGASYHPYSVSSLYAGLLPVDPNLPDAGFDVAALQQHVVSYNVAPRWVLQVTRRLSLNARYKYNGRTASGAIPEHEVSEAGGGLRYNLGRGLDLKLGYRYVDARYASLTSHQSHLIDAGVDFQRALSFSRRTTLSFSTGTSADEDPTTEGGLRYRVIGDATLNHEIGRSWNAGLSYSRNMRFDEGWGEPIFADMAAARFGGLVNRRLSVFTSTGLTRGRQSSDNRKGVDAYFAAAGLNFGLGRFASFGANYQYQYRDYLDGYAFISGSNPLVRRHSVHANVSLWAPLYQQKRRP